MKASSFYFAVLLVAGFVRPAMAGDDTVTINNAWIAEAPPVVKIHAGYAEIINTGQSDRIIKEITSPDFERIEIHRSVIQNGTVKMQYQASVTVPAGDRLILEPGGYHLMLFETRKPLTRGETVPLTFIFEDGGNLVTAAQVKSHRHGNHAH